MVTLTLSNKAAQLLSDCLKDKWVQEDHEDQYTYEFEVIARYLDLALSEEEEHGTK